MSEPTKTVAKKITATPERDADLLLALLGADKGVAGIKTKLEKGWAVEAAGQRVIFLTPREAIL